MVLPLYHSGVQIGRNSVQCHTKGARMALEQTPNPKDPQLLRMFWQWKINDLGYRVGVPDSIFHWNGRILGWEEYQALLSVYQSRLDSLDSPDHTEAQPRLDDGTLMEWHYWAQVRPPLKMIPSPERMEQFFKDSLK